MKRELTPSEIIFSACGNDVTKQININRIPRSNATLNKIKKALSIQKDGYNIYYVDSFSKEKLEELIEFVKGLYIDNNKPKDICYVSNGDSINPQVLVLENGKGQILKDMVDDMKEKYLECINEFYNTSSDEEKEDIIEDVSEKRSNYITDLMDMAKAKNFEIKATTSGFVFIPVKEEGDEMTKDEYDNLENGDQESIEKQAANLKKEAEAILEKLKEIELDSIEKLKTLYREHIKNKMQSYKDDFLLEFIAYDNVYRYLIEMFDYLDDEIIECYSINLEDDEDHIHEVLGKFSVNVLVDNTGIDHPRVIYEEDPTVSNLIGNIEYRNTTSGYSTDMSLISAGSLVKANGGCLILRLTSLVNSGASYYYLKKALIHGQVDYNYTKSYLEVLSIAGLKPEPIPINVKVILIGNYESYEILFDKDEDFKMIFPIRIEAESELKYDINVRRSITDIIEKKSVRDNLLKMTEEAVDELMKYLARIAGSRKKISINEYFVNRILYLADNNAKLENKKQIERQDIIDVAYEEEKILEDVMESYINKKILLTTKGAKVGIINALSVVGTGSYNFGKPMRVTCLALQGEGNIIDIQKECKMSGQIHEKSISILRGLLSSLISPYEKLPVDLQLSFEQTYGMIEGDSASVAEIVCILSALSKKPIKQNIAVTGSINQFGEIQPIGGVNEKIEGFHRVCRLIDTVENKGVLIPASNVDELILNADVEKDINDNKFHVYTMESLDDAIEVLILNEGETVADFFKWLNDEILKYKYDKGSKKKK
ncbi:AAA family ATPase [uncultured Clostridium sp.]|uniref:AAA family ATPase n=1 Tax=uncultured Clostridium sp. TaxID=59620 RepID=UPI0025F462D4|nr:AAA family ATPase [uncultured Clostridium sp.]